MQTHTHAAMKTVSNNKGKKAGTRPGFELPRSSRDPRVAGFKDVWETAPSDALFSPDSSKYSESALGEHVDDLLVNAVSSMH